MNGPRAPAPRSLKARALQWLAQREHSRAELRRKLLVHARAEASGLAAAADVDVVASGAAQHAMLDAAVADQAPAPSPAAAVDALLDWLEVHRYLSQERFVESRVHARAARFGNLRIQRELAQHALALPAAAVQALQASELERARAVRARKFPNPPDSPAQRAHQARFLAGRGFSPEVVRRVLRPSRREDDAEDEPFGTAD